MIPEVHQALQYDYNLKELKGYFNIINQLPTGYKTILNLHFLEGYTHKEIAEILKISEGTSKSQLSKSKQYLKNILLTQLSSEEIKHHVGRLATELV